MEKLIDQLLQSSEPSIRYKIRTQVLGEDPDSQAIRTLRQEIKHSRRVADLLRNRDAVGQLEPVRNPYQKWTGAHWVLATLADLGYPRNDPDLLPVIDQVLRCWLHPDYDRKVPQIEGKYRRCASQHSNILLAVLRLSDYHQEHARHLAQLLLKWQWPDGGWNCDVRPQARVSSFWESWIPLRALALYARQTQDLAALAASQRAAAVFLSRHLYRKRSTGAIMQPEFVKLHYPCYWHYDILAGLKAMAEAGCINRPECAAALDLLEAKQLPGGGWPAEARYYRLLKTTPAKPVSNVELVDWGGCSRGKMNEWVTADALYVLKEAGRLNGR